MTRTTITRAAAEAHEALWLQLQALHKDTLALGAKKPTVPVGEALRITAESLLSDCARFTRRKGDRLPVAAAELGGLAVQLGQALAALEEWEAHHTGWDERLNCRIWRVDSGYLPIMRLKPPAAALKLAAREIEDLRAKLVDRLISRNAGDFYQAFRAGRDVERGERSVAEVQAAFEKIYPRLRLHD